MDPTRRFSSRAENYAKYRPGYPDALYAYLASQAGLLPGDNVVDIGSGTGLLSALFLSHGHVVYGVERNAEMRAYAENQFHGESRFNSLDGRAESIPISDGSVEMVVVGQAFHWFDSKVAKREIQRVLAHGRQVALIWNRRDTQKSAFLAAYEALLDKYGTDYKLVDHKRTVADEEIAEFFAPNPFGKTALPNRHTLDEEGLKGRLLSSSYAPMEGDANHQPMIAELSEIFAQFQNKQLIHFDYLATVYHGEIHTPH
jgi:SAM-dependent methyltransferase